jgi:dTDP-4-dehydrorhamnose reductase
MGRKLVETLSTDMPHIQVVTINRGNAYWGVPGCPTIVADRRNRAEYRRMILEVLPKHDWIGVVDFCAYSVADVEESLPDEIHSLKYILISTDSVYEIVDDRGSPVEETRISGNAESGDLHPERDRYGYKKFLVENFLLKNGSKAVCLRLPDVIGEFDDTLRFWAIKLWIGTGVPVYCSDLSRPISLVYSRDVVRLIMKIFFESSNNYSSGCYNVCSDEQITFPELLKLMNRGTPVQTTVEPPCKEFLPSVEHRISRLCNMKAKRVFGFEATPLTIAIRRTLNWLAEVGELIHKDEYRETIAELPKRVRIRHIN